jgi:hypothetical protein
MAFGKPSPTPKQRSLHDLVPFDSRSETPERVVEFLSGGVAKGGVALAIALTEHADFLRRRLPRERVTILDAGKTLNEILEDGQPDPVRFRRVIGGLVRRAAAQGPVYAYGEMVALLCMTGRHEAALRLEELWNELVPEVGAQLLCGYPRTVLASQEDAAIIRSIKRQHAATKWRREQGVLARAAASPVRR